MGEQKVSQAQEAEYLRVFSRSLIRDLQALEEMLDKELFETDVRRIGAEQELFLVDENWRPDSGCHPPHEDKADQLFAGG